MRAAPRHRWLALALLGLLPPAAARAGPVADGTPQRAGEREPVVLPNFALRTLGGRQLWADVGWRQGWRVQQHALTGHHRLLDPKDVRRAWGDEAACRAELARAALREGLRPASDRLVVLLHGLFRSRQAFAALERALRAEGYDVASLGYPSTRRSIEHNAAVVRALVAELEGYREVSFVTHSLGGLVARVVLSDPDPWGGAPRAARLVMLGPPNQGAALARTLERIVPLAWIAGPAGAALAGGAGRPGPAELPLPRVPFAIVAGGRGDALGYNPLLEGDDDGVVRVAETALDGAAGVLVVPGLHSFLMQHEAAIAATLAFLAQGELPAAGAPR